MNDQSPCYLAFLLRLWCVTEEDGVVWRASLEDAHSGERRGFASLKSLCLFLNELTQGVTGDEEHRPISDDADSC
jgi:hypothetical protein